LPSSASTPTPPSGFTLRDSGFSYGDAPLLAPLELRLRPGEIVAILGPSGSGKSTLLKRLAGLLPGGEAPDLPGHIAWMAQQDLLLPWLSLRENVLLGARLRGEPADAAVAEALLTRLGLGEWRAARPAALSGGMRQRAALARTLVENRPLVLMDEPFSALDAITREEMQDLACAMLADRCALLVTHDPAEACRIADRIFVLAGRPAVLTEIAVFPHRGPRDTLDDAVLPVLRRVHAALREATA
jgi:putative hydroxymethylpyrimidine transport system ATP-binding protein